MRRALAVVLLLLAGCAGQKVPPGPGPETPRLTESRIVADDGYELPLTVWQPAAGDPKAVILALHGFNDYANAFADFGTVMSGWGIAVYAFDQRGFGRGLNRGLWAGGDVLAGDARTVLGLLAARHPGIPLFLLGESMGGAVATLAVDGSAGRAPDGVILSAPAVWSAARMPWYVDLAIDTLTGLFPGYRATGRGFGVLPTDNIPILRAMRDDPNMLRETRLDAVGGLVDLMNAAALVMPRLDLPVLYLYGARDELVPRTPSTAAMQALPYKGPALWQGQKAAVYRDGFHLLLRDLQAPTVFRDIAAWIEDPHARLPSGADVYAELLLSGAIAWPPPRRQRSASSAEFEIQDADR